MQCGITRVALLLAVVANTLAAQSQEPLPRFRAGAALMQVDTYISQDGISVTDLGLADLEVLEDERPQAITNIKLVQPRSTIVSAPVPPEPVGALFVLFFDTLHVRPESAARANEQMSKLLNSVMGPHDRVGIMTPEISAQNITLTKPAGGVDAVLRDMSLVAEPGGDSDSDTRERGLEMCYPDATMAGVARELIMRRREQTTLRALDDLVTFLEGRRDERKFVIVISPGWTLFRRNDQLAAPAGGDPRRRDAGVDACEPERRMLAAVDDVVEMRKLAQRANRANVSVYPVDAGGIVEEPAVMAADAERVMARQNGLRELAVQTHGTALLTANEVVGGVTRIRADLQPYYVLSYYSSNTNLDGRFRRVIVRVKREGFEVRARPGYLSLTDAEGRAAGLGSSSAPMNRVSPPVIGRPSERTTASAAPVSVRMQAVGGDGSISTIIEVDSAALKRADWFTGGSVRVSIAPERGGEAATIDADIEPGQQVASLTSTSILQPGRYLVRAELKSRTGASILRGSVTVTVPVATALAGTTALASRRGPGTGLIFQRTADPRFRRTERIQIEVPLLSESVKHSGRLLTRTGQAMPLTVTASERLDGTTKWAVADVGLAPLAAGDYVLELSFAEGEKVEIVAYPFRVVP